MQSESSIPSPLETPKQESNQSNYTGIFVCKVAAALIFFSRFTDAEEKLGSFLEALYDRDESRFKEELGFHCSFRSRTPTGHYEFDFNQLAHKCLAARLMDLGRAEIPSPVFRNIIYKTHTDPVVHLPLSIGPPEFLKSNIPRKGKTKLNSFVLSAFWSIGTLTLDYLSFNNAAKEASPLSIESVKELLPNVFKKQDLLQGREQKLRYSKEAKGHGEMNLEAMHELKQELWKIHLTTEHALHIINSFKASLLLFLFKNPFMFALVESREGRSCSCIVPSSDRP